MKSAARIVDALLEDEGAKEFLGRQPDLALSATLLAAIDDTGVAREDIDGIEVYGVIRSDDGYVLDRAGQGEKANGYGLSIHEVHSLHGGGLHDIGDYNTPEEALEAARQLRIMLPHVTIFYDEISPA